MKKGISDSQREALRCCMIVLCHLLRDTTLPRRAHDWARWKRDTLLVATRFIVRSYAARNTFAYRRAVLSVDVAICSLADDMAAIGQLQPRYVN